MAGESSDHLKLMSVLKQMGAREKSREKWKRVPRTKGELREKSLTKNGNVKLVLISNDGESHTVYVLKRNKNLFEKTATIQVGDFVSTILLRYLSRYFCTKIDVKKDARLTKWL